MKMRFGELEKGRVFHAFGQELRKQDDYNAVTTSKQGKQNFLFFKQNLVEVDVSPLSETRRYRISVRDHFLTQEHHLVTLYIDEFCVAICPLFALGAESRSLIFKGGPHNSPDFRIRRSGQSPNVKWEIIFGDAAHEMVEVENGFCYVERK